MHRGLTEGTCLPPSHPHLNMAVQNQSKTRVTLVPELPQGVGPTEESHWLRGCHRPGRTGETLKYFTDLERMSSCFHMALFNYKKRNIRGHIYLRPLGLSQPGKQYY